MTYGDHTRTRYLNRSSERREEMEEALAKAQLTELARYAYGAYGDNALWKNFRGEAMPVWESLPPEIQDNWRAVAREMRSLLAHSSAPRVDFNR